VHAPVSTRRRWLFFLLALPTNALSSPDLVPRLVVEAGGVPGGRMVQVRGRWGAAEMGDRKVVQALYSQLQAIPAAPDVAWDLRGLAWLDHVGAQLLWRHWGQAWPAQILVDRRERDILERVAQFTVAPPPDEPWRLADQIDHLGVLVLHGVDHARHLLHQ
jgi:phospholipid/cholesterol/gamma-HCH transport system permease protein